MQYDTSMSPEEIASINGALRPSHFRILVAMPTVIQKIGSVYIPGSRADDEENASTVATVLALGPNAFCDKERFPTGALCSVGDHIIISPYQGVRLKIGDREVRLISDTGVLGLAMQPEKVSRYYES